MIFTISKDGFLIVLDSKGKIIRSNYENYNDGDLNLSISQNDINTLHRIESSRISLAFFREHLCVRNGSNIMGLRSGRINHPWFGCFKNKKPLYWTIVCSLVRYSISLKEIL